MIKVTVLPDSARQITWGAKPGREAGSMRIQEAWLHTVDRDGKPSPFPEKVEVPLDRATDSRSQQADYAAGEYTLHPSSVYVSREGKPAFAVRLTPAAKRPV